MSTEGRALYDHAVKLAREIGFDPDRFTAGGGSDGNFTGAPGVPTLDGLGLVGRGFHTESEPLLFSSIEPRARLLYRLFVTLESIPLLGRPSGGRAAVWSRPPPALLTKI